MIAEVVAVGTELLLGQIVNTNAADIGSRLAEDGFDVHYQVTVGDNLDRLVAAITTAAGRADAVILTGGIGPTQDDMTRDALCVVLDTDITRDPIHEAKIRDRLAARGVVADTALRMADYPTGATPLPNTKGVALGIAADFQGTPIFAVPGVPTEMRAMIDNEVRPRLREASGEPSILINRQLHCWGLGESQIAETLDDLYQSTNPSVAFLINGPEVRVRITAKAGTARAAEAMIAVVETEVRSRLGDVIFAIDDETVDGLVADLLAGRGWTISVVETFTAGQVTTRLSPMTGFAAGLVVPAGRLDHGYAGQSVEGQVRALLESAAVADLQIAVGDVTGQPSGDGTAGRTFSLAIRTPDHTEVRTLGLLGDDERARRFAVPGVMHVLRQILS